MKIGVVGAGSWGTSLANVLAKKGYAVTLWAHEAELVGYMRTHGENNQYLPGIKLHQNLCFSSDLQDAVARDVVVLVPPSQRMRVVLEKAAPHFNPEAMVISASKGIEDTTLELMSNVIAKALHGRHNKEKTAFLSGPTFAREIALEIPSAAVVAANNEDIVTMARDLFSTDYFRIYSNDDVIGTEVGGALKNIMALAAGVCDGLKYGHNTRAALITRGLAEMKRVGIALGARPETFAGLAGMGDLVLTCTGDLSRNRTVGIALGEGQKLDAILAHMNMVAEGVETAKSAYHLAQKLDVDVPIINEMYALLYENKDPRRAVVELMRRTLKAEYI
ncbi:MAG: NAD(P)H-dependent glycerol-3-phosphate dehydrogenase [Desulfuromonadaceae bacterium]|nr:NAD(P)-dependent glycerol-3-phosphate dehydrogenase [Desulfuromonas sp.]MDY0184925.1 NAD(P)H-dependent glycerol-3-phosphate dehydrogenase [Desulfuromonadaceae bacterium]